MTTERTRGVRPIDGERRFRMAFDAAAVGIALVDLTGRMVECNGALHDMLGYETGELRGKTFADLTYPADLGDRDCLDEVLAAKRETCVLERRYLRKNGSLVWAKLVTSVVRDAGRAPRYGVGVLADVGDKHELEDAFLHSQKLAAVGRLSGGAALDFNNLLTVIRGYSEFIIEQTADDDARRAYADEIRRSAEQASVLTHQLLALMRQRARHPQAIDANHVIRDLHRMLSRVLGADVALTVRLSDEPATIFFDPAQLQHVLINLAANARDAMHSGGALLIETDRVAASANHRAGDRQTYVRLSVTDTGAGIPADVQPRIFEPYFTTKEETEALGLGLSTVYSIVDEAGGFVKLRSDPCRNTTFDVYLPAVTDRAEDDADELPSRPSLGAIVLLVEDDKAVRRVATRALEEAGYRVLVAGSGEEAMDVAAGVDGSIEALITDVLMPGMTGSTLAARLGVLRSNIRVLYISGHIDTMLARFGIDEERDQVLRKPFAPTELVGRVRELLAIS